MWVEMTVACFVMMMMADNPPALDFNARARLPPSLVTDAPIAWYLIRAPSRREPQACLVSREAGCDLETLWFIESENCASAAEAERRSIIPTAAGRSDTATLFSGVSSCGWNISARYSFFFPPPASALIWAAHSKVVGDGWSWWTD